MTWTPGSTTGQEMADDFNALEDAVNDNSENITSLQNSVTTLDDETVKTEGNQTIQGKITVVGASSSVAQGANAEDLTRRDFVETSISTLQSDIEDDLTLYAKLGENVNFDTVSVVGGLLFSHILTPANTSKIQILNTLDRQVLRLFSKSGVTNGGYIDLFGENDSTLQNAVKISAASECNVLVSEDGVFIDKKSTLAGASSSVAQGTNASDLTRRDFVETSINAIDTGMHNLEDDTNPVLGGDLDLGGYDLVDTGSSIRVRTPTLVQHPLTGENVTFVQANENGNVSQYGYSSIHDTYRINISSSLSILSSGVITLSGTDTVVSHAQGTENNSITRRDFVEGLDSDNVKLTGTQTVSGTKTFTSKPTLAGASSSTIQGANANDFTRRDFVAGLDSGNAKLGEDANFTNLSVENAITLVNQQTPSSMPKIDTFNSIGREILRLYSSYNERGGSILLYGDSDSGTPNRVLIQQDLNGNGISITETGVDIQGAVNAESKVTSAGSASSVSQGANANDFTRRDFVETSISNLDTGLHRLFDDNSPVPKTSLKLGTFTDNYDPTQTANGTRITHFQPAPAASSSQSSTQSSVAFHEGNPASYSILGGNSITLTNVGASKYNYDTKLVMGLGVNSWQLHRFDSGETQAFLGNTATPVEYKCTRPPSDNMIQVTNADGSTVWKPYPVSS